MKSRGIGKLTRSNYWRRLPHRCVKCKTRRTLVQLWSLYLRPPKCNACGYHRLKPCFDRLHTGRRFKCNCTGYHFPHRRGSKFCDHNERHAEHWEERMNEGLTSRSRPCA